MRTKKMMIFGIVILNYFTIFSQDKGICPIVKFDSDWSEEICLEYKSQSQFYSFIDNEEAIKYVEELMNLAGLPMNFIVSECSGIENAFAYTYDGVQYIFYGNEFLESLNSKSNDIGSITVLAHEIGHHLSGHTSANSYIEKYCDYPICTDPSQDCLDALEISRKRELQADRFAGFIMKKFGASLDDTQNAFRKLLNNQEKDDICSTHPSLSKRLESIKEGYDKAKSQERHVERAIQTAEAKLEEIKGDEIELNVSHKSRIERNRLVNETCELVVGNYRSKVIRNSEYRLEKSGIETPKGIVSRISDYLGYEVKGYTEINTEREFFRFNVASIAFKDDSRINYGPILGYHSKNGIFSIVQFGDNSTKIIYSTLADKSAIDFDELEKIIVQNFKMGLKQELEKYE